jgi:hypothetical protein
MKEPYRSDKRNYEQRQGHSDVERERYLEKLRLKTERRYNTKVLRNMAFAVGEEHAEKTSQKHLGAIAKRTEFRAHLKQTVIDSHKAHEHMHRKLGQLYRERLTWFVSRSLEHAATARNEFDQYHRSRPPLPLNTEPQPPAVSSAEQIDG